MAWETRTSGGSYYTRSHRRNGRIIREYIGGGVIGQMAAEKDTRQRAERRQRAAAREAQRQQLKELETQITMFGEMCDLFTMANLLPEGHYRDNKNGAWRKKRAR